MRELVNRLEHMGWINRDLQLAASVSDLESDRLLELRADFNFECNQALNELTGMLSQHDTAKLASRMLGDLVTLHRYLSEHQQRWTPTAIDREPDAYVSKSRQINANVTNFIEASLEFLSAVADKHQATAANDFSENTRLTGTR